MPEAKQELSVLEITICTAMTPRLGSMRECGAQAINEGLCAEHYERRKKMGV